jgi:tetratricopeptide (TPR) repeat protein
MRRLRLLLAGAALATAAPALAAPMPPLQTIAVTPAEQALLARLVAIASPDSASANPVGYAAQLTKIDALLAELPRPSPLRGAVQLTRAELLVVVGRYEDATAAALEAIRLLPGYSTPLYVAANVETYRDRPREALDHLVAAAAIDPGPLASLGEFNVGSLVGRLDEQRESARLAQLGDLLARAGWKGSPDTVSTLAFARVAARLQAGDIEAAGRLVGEISLPGAMSKVLTDKRFAPVHAIARAQAGPRLEKLWPRYLAETQSQWQAGAHDRSRRVYADALVAAGHDHSLIATFAPLFEGPIDPEDHSFLFAAVPVARAHARLGQWQRGYDLLAKVEAAFADQDVANRLNVTAARAQLLKEEGRLEEAAAAFDSLIAESLRRPSEVGEHNLAVMHGQRACVLDALGRSAEAAHSWRFLREREDIDPPPLVDALVCRDDLAAARRVIVAALAREAIRTTALAMVQPPSRGPFPSEQSRLHAKRWERLRADPKLRAAASRYGELRTEPLNAAAPPDPLLGRETPRR